MQTFSFIDIDFIKFSDKGSEIRVNALIETSKVGTCHPCSILPFFNDKPELCLATTLQYRCYLNAVLAKSLLRTV